MTFIDGLVTALLTYAMHSFAACAAALGVGRMLRRPQDRESGSHSHEATRVGARAQQACK